MRCCNSVKNWRFVYRGCVLILNNNCRRRQRLLLWRKYILAAQNEVFLMLLGSTHRRHLFHRLRDLTKRILKFLNVILRRITSVYLLVLRIFRHFKFLRFSYNVSYCRISQLLFALLFMLVKRLFVNHLYLLFAVLTLDKCQVLRGRL